MNDVISRLKTKRKTQILPPHVIKNEQEIHTPHRDCLAQTPDWSNWPLNWWPLRMARTILAGEWGKYKLKRLNRGSFFAQEKTLQTHQQVRMWLNSLQIGTHLYVMARTILAREWGKYKLKQLNRGSLFCTRKDTSNTSTSVHVIEFTENRNASLGDIYQYLLALLAYFFLFQHLITMSRSWIWEYFNLRKEDNEQRAYCKLCPNKFFVYHNSTSTLSYHLQAVHNKGSSSFAASQRYYYFYFLYDFFI